MKNLLLITLLCLTAAYGAYAQQKPTNYMTITITEFNGFTIGKAQPNMIITRTDTAQLQLNIDFNQHAKLKDAFAAHENFLLQTLKPYFDQGWKLVSTTLENENQVATKIYRYYFSRAE